MMLSLLHLGKAPEAELDPRGFQELTADLDSALDLLEDLTDLNPCWFDPSGVCRTHRNRGLRYECKVSKALVLLKKYGRGTKSHY